jgi:hypothetical protein
VKKTNSHTLRSCGGNGSVSVSAVIVFDGTRADLLSSSFSANTQLFMTLLDCSAATMPHALVPSRSPAAIVP